MRSMGRLKDLGGIFCMGMGNRNERRGGEEYIFSFLVGFSRKNV
jgi:hypothetical protein